MNMKKYVAYYRVSTEDQGNSGLGLAGQKSYVRGFIHSNKGHLSDEFRDVETGKSNTRDNLLEAIKLCKITGATLIAYDITRISRGGFVVMAEIQKSGIEFISAIDPHDSDFIKAIKFSVAKEEADRISRNTKKAIDIIKDKIARGEKHISKSGKVVTKLGSPKPIDKKVGLMGAEAMRMKALLNPENKKAGAYIVSLKNSGDSFYRIAQKLKDAGFKTTRGNDYSQVQTKKLYERYAE